jgi:transposase
VAIERFSGVRRNSVVDVTRRARRRAHRLTVEWLPKYPPDLNDIERVWHDLKAHHLAYQTFVDTDDLDRAIHQAVGGLNAEQTALPLAEPRTSA